MGKRFRITYEVDVTLDERELWPDGDGPANPTAADVEALIEEEGGYGYVIRAWSLNDDAAGAVSEVSPVVSPSMPTRGGDT